MHSQLDNLTDHLDKFSIPYKILESGYTFAELFKHIWENDFIISSPDIIFYILLRQKHTQHIKYQYSEFINHLHSVIFDELHLFDTYTLFNIGNLIEIMKNIKNKGLEELSSDDAVSTRKLLDVLFPDLYNVREGRRVRDEFYGQLTEEKRMGSVDYFDRYFSYTTLIGEISYQRVAEFLARLEGKPEEDIITEIKRIVRDRRVDMFVLKLKRGTENLAPHSSRSLALAIAKIGDTFPNTESTVPFTSTFS
jgi:hypothetical protein